MEKDIKVFETFGQILEDQEWWRGKHSPIEFFAEAVARTRMETGGVAIKDIAKCFKAQFDEEEIKSLIRELTS